MIIRIGDVNIAGPGYRVAKLTQKPDFNFSSNGGSGVCIDPDAGMGDAELAFQVYALGGCSLADIEDRRLAVETELNLANSSGGHMVYYEKVDDWSMRREIVQGVVEPKDFALRYKRMPKVSFEVRVKVRSTRVLSPVLAKADEAAWTSGVYKAALLMSNTTAGVDYLTAAEVADIGTLDRFDGTGYADVTLTNKVRNTDDTPVYLKAGDLVWVNLPNGTRPIAGILIYEFVTDDTDSPIVGYIPSSNWAQNSIAGSGNFNPSGSTTKFLVNARGLLWEP